MKIDNDAIAYPAKSLFGPALSNTVSSMAMSNDILFKCNTSVNFYRKIKS